MIITVMDYSTQSITMIEVNGKCFQSIEETEVWLEHHGFHLSQIYFMMSEDKPDIGESTQEELEEMMCERRCSHCGKLIKEGYCIEGGVEYYCSDECLHEHYTDEEYLELYDEGNGDSYWTQWDEKGGTKNSDVFRKR